jgi:hypothetical protein
VDSTSGFYTVYVSHYNARGRGGRYVQYATNLTEREAAPLVEELHRDETVSWVYSAPMDAAERPVVPARPTERGGTFVVSWGKNGGFYASRLHGWTRLCLWRVAFTYIQRDLDAVLADAVRTKDQGHG